MTKKTILIVDDEVDILKLLEDLLKSRGYKVVKAKSGFEALKILKKIKPDLIILDFFMPRMTGGDVCEKIRTDPKLKNLKVIFLTVARFSKPGLDKLDEMRVLDYIRKPFDNMDLIKRIEKVIKKPKE